MLYPLIRPVASLPNPRSFALPMRQGQAGDRCREIRNGRTPETAQIHRSKVRASEGEAGHPGRDGTLRGGHDLGGHGAGVEMPVVHFLLLRIAIIEQGQQLAFRGERDQPVGLHDGDPKVAVLVKGEAVRRAAQVRGPEGFAVAEPAVRTHPQAGDAARVRLDHVKPLFLRVESNLVGTDEPLSDDANSALIDEADIAVRRLFVDRSGPRHQTSRHREPDAVLRVAQYEIGLAQRLSVDMGVQSARRAVAMHEFDGVGTEVRDEEITHAIHGNPVRQRGASQYQRRRIVGIDPPMSGLRDQPLRAVGTDAHHAAAGIGAPESAVALREDALGALQIRANRSNDGTIHGPADERIASHITRSAKARAAQAWPGRHHARTRPPRPPVSRAADSGRNSPRARGWNRNSPASAHRRREPRRSRRRAATSRHATRAESRRGSRGTHPATESQHAIDYRPRNESTSARWSNPRTRDRRMDGLRPVRGRCRSRTPTFGRSAAAAEPRLPKAVWSG